MTNGTKTPESKSLALGEEVALEFSDEWNDLGGPYPGSLDRATFLVLRDA
jgi:hypothetical protein